MEKEVVEISDNPIGTGCDETIVVSDDSRSISVEITDYSHSRQRARSSKSASRVLFITKVCLLVPALCSIIMGFSVVMHGILKVCFEGTHLSQDSVPIIARNIGYKTDV